MSSGKYCALIVTNVSTALEKKGHESPSKYVKSFSDGYRSELDTPSELKADRL